MEDNSEIQFWNESINETNLNLKKKGNDEDNKNLEEEYSKKKKMLALKF